MKRASVAAAVLFFAATAAFASWYDDYDAGLDAVRKGQWQSVITKMTAAINGNPKENDKARTYGAIFINYHPYYYRGVAYLNVGKYDRAVSDFEKTSGPGPEDLGSIDTPPAGKICTCFGANEARFHDWRLLINHRGFHREL